MLLPGKPSDEVADVLATGNGDITTTFVSMATRHPDGTDADYLQWHTLDHRPEQHRLSAVRASLRLVSTPACRAARAVRHERFDPVDHVMTYFFTDTAGMDGFLTLSTALGGAGRKLPLLPPVERGVYGVQGRVAAARIKVGADVLPWWPARGVYLLLETHGASPAENCSTSRALPESGRWPHSTSVRNLRAHERGSNSPTASSTTTRSLPRHGCGRCLRSVGKQRTSIRCSPRPFTRSCLTSGAAMCRDRRPAGHADAVWNGRLLFGIKDPRYVRT